VPGEDARTEIEEVTMVLRSVRREFIAEVVEQSGHGDPYINVNEADDLLEESAEDAPIEVISVLPIDSLQVAIVEVLSSGRLAYDYQVYQIVAWLLEYCTEPSGELMDFIRATSFSPHRPRYVKTVCTAFLGKFGVAADLERLSDSYDLTTDPSERVETICSLRRLERGRRNAFFARVERDGEMNRRAVKWVKAASAA
jgi:hypothetical protein